MVDIPYAFGDSAIAGMMHQVELWNAANGTPPLGDPLQMYTEITAFEPEDA